MEDYSYTMCSITEDICTRYAGCYGCDIAKKHEVWQKAADKKADFEGTTTFDKWCKMFGVSIEINQFDYLARCTIDQFNQMIQDDPLYPKTECGYNLDSMKQYLEFMKLKRFLNLGIPLRVLIKKDSIGAFIYSDVVYLCAPKLLE